MKAKKRSIFLGLIFSLLVSTSTLAADCSLNSAGSRIQHVIYIQFDNVHFTRDNPNVPSDLEQMPNLLNFVRHNGTLLTNHHTPLISHTADDIVTALTGVYPSRHGLAVANSYGIFTPTGFSFPSAFTYWTDPVNTTTDTRFNLLAADGKNAPAPWAPFTRAGCNVGAVSLADMEIENTGSDLTTIFGAGSPEVQEAINNGKSKDPKVRAQTAADFEGVAIHCASGQPLCAAANGGVPDVLPQEPLGYNGFNGLFGHKFAVPAINGGDPALKDLDGNVITDFRGNIGFPGFGPITVAQSLAYTAAMHEHGVPVTFSYISDAHEGPDGPFGPGQAEYVARLAAYDEAWGKFFARLAADGITTRNALFIITADEGDHFSGGPPAPAGCDGVHVPCTYSKIGDISANVASLLTKIDPSLASTQFAIHFDMAPTFYLKGQPAATDPKVRAFERAAAQLTAVSPISGNTDQLTRFLADPVEMNLLHMITADPQRTPTFVLFGHPDYFFLTSGPDVQEDPGNAWNHGGVAPEVNTTWLGIAGPGVERRGIEDANDVWSDHTDIRPTMLVLTGLTDDYAHDGRALVEILDDRALPRALERHDEAFERLARLYKQINAPIGQLGLDSLAASTAALAGDDATFTRLESQLQDITNRRDTLAAEIIHVLEDAEFNYKSINPATAAELSRQAERLLDRVHDLKESLAGGDDDDPHHHDD